MLDLRRAVGEFLPISLSCLRGTSEPQLKAIVSGFEARLKDHKRSPLGIDGFPLSQWVVADYGDVVVHVFHTTKRAIYRLEDFWNDAETSS